MMENHFNYFEKKVIDLLEENLKNSKDNNLLLKSLLDKDLNKKNKFDLSTKKAACKYLNCSKEALNNSINKGVLMQNVHYRHNGRRTWIFSKSMLEPLVGKL
ncbi:hypothetical protein [Aliarcobacter skirrowii]|uniref:hypothetical protein n=1 Tax=Aliarcobacter skirrowii TaxID=28200 RepID=UPI000D611E63|nr:hypothetical protein [Aliarcobacter skirrowii]PWE20124.1 hypothetical protein DGF29_07185 [Aliarcobacter skirrowii]PWE23935.1 hypothetical protein DGE88_10285 [Aliarcobacter skirrowii]RJO55571.1 hypothetical protein DIR39_07190 [Aliarcobacter skirrowii]RJO57526.1 hypothetical protein DIR38_07190 [Aliarcobacter skirrowii]